MRRIEKRISRRQILQSVSASAFVAACPALVRGQTLSTFKILLASGSPTLAWAASHIAESLGYYRDVGLKIERIVNNSDPAALTALIAGSGHAQHSAPGAFLVASARGQKLKTLVALSNYNALYFVVSKAFAAKHGLKEDMPAATRLAALKDFKGLRCGITAPGSQTDTTIRVILKAGGLDPNIDAQLIPLGSTVNSLAAMGRDAIDALLASPPVPEFAVAQLGAVRLLSVGKDEVPGLKALASHSMLARASDVEEKPDLYRGAVFAIVRALQYITENPDAGDAVYKAGFSTAVTPELWPTVWNQNKAQFRTPYMTTEGLEAWVKLGLVPNVSDPTAVHADELVDMRFVDEAVRKLGWTTPQ